MFRRSRLLALLLLVGGVALCFGGVFYLAKREPDFYQRAPDPDDFETRELRSVRERSIRLEGVGNLEAPEDRYLTLPIGSHAEPDRRVEQHDERETARERRRRTRR